MSAMTPPRANWQASWATLTGYVQQARDDGAGLDPDVLLVVMADLKREALAPVAAWLRSMGEATP